MTSLVGVLELSSKYRYGITSRGAPFYLFRPYADGQPDMIVGCSHRDTSRNQIAMVSPPIEPRAPGQKPRGTLIRLIGHVGSEAVERAGLLEHYCITRTYTGSVPYIDESDDSVREDINAATGWLVFHIDPPGCRDIDDALAWHADTGTWAITIADAAAVVPFDSALNDTARQIGETFYSTTGEVQRSMLPSSISEDCASLVPGSRRRGVTYFFKEGATTTKTTMDRWALTWITVTHGLTYDSFPQSDVARQLGLRDRDAHSLVETMMILYNRRAADLLQRTAPAAGILRVQPQPDAIALASWSAIDPTLARMAHEAATYEFVTTDHDQSHAGLCLNAYCHASSPLRRYADLANQRLIKAHINGGIVGSSLRRESMDLAEHLNNRTRAARRWARDLLFLEQVTPGKVHEIIVLWVDATRVWVPVWNRLIRLRHETQPLRPGTHDRMRIFCDPTKRNWRQRILTAPSLTFEPAD